MKKKKKLMTSEKRKKVLEMWKEQKMNESKTEKSKLKSKKKKRWIDKKGKKSKKIVGTEVLVKLNYFTPKKICTWNFVQSNDSLFIKLYNSTIHIYI